eukprot:COSAG01_NODE_8212_length_2873_cov_2.841024_2_plen_132_part_00
MGDDGDTSEDSHSSLRKDTKVKSLPLQLIAALSYILRLPNCLFSYFAGATTFQILAGENSSIAVGDGHAHEVRVTIAAANGGGRVVFYLPTWLQVHGGSRAEHHATPLSPVWVTVWVAVVGSVLVAVAGRK